MERVNIPAKFLLPKFSFGRSALCLKHWETFQFMKLTITECSKRKVQFLCYKNLGEPDDQFHWSFIGSMKAQIQFCCNLYTCVHRMLCAEYVGLFCVFLRDVLNYNTRRDNFKKSLFIFWAPLCRASRGVFILVEDIQGPKRNIYLVVP